MSSSDHISIRVSASNAPASRERSGDPFKLLLLGDFSGRAARPADAGAPAAFRIVEVDRDNFPDRLRALDAHFELAISEKGERVRIAPRELDDLHPDRLFEHVPLFDTLRELRREMSDPATFATISAKARRVESERATARSEMPELDPESVPSSFLDAILERANVGHHDAGRLDSTDWGFLLRDILRPYVSPKPDPKQAEMIASIDDASGELLRRILHHPTFQSVESNWRSLRLLVSRIESGSGVQIYILDTTKEELAANLAGIEEMLNDHGARVEGEWGAIAAMYSFEPSLEDVALLGSIGSVASSIGAPFIAEASPRLVGCESIASFQEGAWGEVESERERAWNELRAGGNAGYLGLVMPRVLLRLPYGEETDPIEDFRFEEMPNGEEHHRHLWGSPAAVAAVMLAGSFGIDGWGMRPGTVGTIERLPLNVYRQEGESRITSPVEIYPSQSAIERAIDRGIMLLAPVHDSGAAAMVRFQSIAQPPRPLAGRWDRTSA